TTEVAVPTVTYTTNVNGQIIVPDFLYTSDQTVTVTNTSGRDVEIRDQFGNVITGNSVVVKANDPNEEQIGSNIFQTNIFTIENEMKYAKVSGTVWDDGQYNARNNLLEDSDIRLPKVKVYLHDPVNNV